MSYDPNDPNQQDPSQVDKAIQPDSGQKQPDSSDSQPSTSNGGGGGVASAGTTPTSGGAQGSTPSKSGSWTNLQSYLDANADQGAKVGSDIASTVNQAGQKAQSDTSSLDTNFNQAVNDNTVSADPNAVQTAIGAATSLKAGQTLGQDQSDAYNKQANASYGGPTDVTSYGGYGQAAQDVNQASTLANQTQSESGRDVLLNNQYQNASANGYNQGENNLDQLLLQNSTGGQQALQPLAGQWAGLDGELNNTVTSGNAKAQGAVTTDQATSAAAKAALVPATQNFQNQITTGLANLQKTNAGAYSQIMADIKSGHLTPEDGKALGIDPNTSNYGVDGTQYLTQGVQPTLQSFATADQYAQAQALAQLAGQSSSSFLAPGSVSQAGTAQGAPAYSFNSDQYKSNVATNQGEFTNSLSNLKNGPQGWAQNLGTIPSNISHGRNLAAATPQDLASYWIPVMAYLKTHNDDSGLNYSMMTNILQNALAKANAIAADYGQPQYTAGAPFAPHGAT